MHTAPDDPLVAATARLLSHQPALTNLQLIRRLAADLGREVVARVPVNRFQSQVREPALRLLHAQGTNGGLEPRPNGPAPVSVESNGVEPRGELEESQADGLSRDDLDEALLEAFVLGASWESETEGIAAFRRLEELRRRIRERVRSGG